MSDYKWLLDNLFCLASMAEFRGQPEVSELLLKIHQDVSVMTPSSSYQVVRKGDVNIVR